MPLVGDCARIDREPALLPGISGAGWRMRFLDKADLMWSEQ
nr:hypothetical protein [Kibdelosporangium sp. MJ126-NF4]CTQ88424.1 hypothetical protein [Kibdelosporangium sp. MJ126-NF4]